MQRTKGFFLIHRLELQHFLDKTLNSFLFKDYGPNGLQIEGKEEIKKIAFSVSATLDSISQAVALHADALIVHHGILWNAQGPRPIVGSQYKRMAPLIKNDINLLAYHLPLDGHLEIGTAASIAKELNLQIKAPYGEYKGMPTGVWGEFASPLLPGELCQKVKMATEHNVISTPSLVSSIKTLAIITGGSSHGWRDCPRLNIDAFLTGEITEHDWHDCHEAGVLMMAAGHHATERPGVLSLMEFVKSKFQVDVTFIDSPNPA